MKDVAVLACTAFGGPQAHLAMMFRLLVDKRRYINTAELLELITVLALLSELREARPELHGPHVTRAELRAAGILPVPPASRRPASVLDHHEEGPEGQFALL